MSEVDEGRCPRCYTFHYGGDFAACYEARPLTAVERLKLDAIEIHERANRAEAERDELRQALADARARITELEGERDNARQGLEELDRYSRRLEGELAAEKREVAECRAAVSRFAQPGDTAAMAIGRMEDRIIDLAGESVLAASELDEIRDALDVAGRPDMLSAAETIRQMHLAIIDGHDEASAARADAERLRALLVAIDELLLGETRWSVDMNRDRSGTLTRLIHTAIAFRHLIHARVSDDDFTRLHDEARRLVDMCDRASGSARPLMDELARDEDESIALTAPEGTHDKGGDE